jgi:polyhydroxybutyrate depolymerase
LPSASAERFEENKTARATISFFTRLSYQHIRFGPAPKWFQGFIVVYPEGLNKHWNDGRDAPRFAEQDATIDDVAFVLALLKSLPTAHEIKIDSERVYATGASNGGFISQRLALDAADTFAAVGVIIATMGTPLAEPERFKPSQPVSILFMNGTADPFVPYDGGPITPNFTPRRRTAEKDYGRGECTSTDKAISLWIEHNQLAAEPITESLPDKDTTDSCTVKKSTWHSTDKSNPTEVVLYRIEGGGHTIPGGVQYLPEAIIGKTCQDFDGVATVWDFLSKHHLSE